MPYVLSHSLQSSRHGSCVDSVDELEMSLSSYCIHIYMHTDSYLYTYTNTCVTIPVCIYIYIYTYTHIYIYAHIRRERERCSSAAILSARNDLFLKLPKTERQARVGFLRSVA